jgi:hypothetical protein
MPDREQERQGLKRVILEFFEPPELPRIPPQIHRIREDLEYEPHSLISISEAIRVAMGNEDGLELETKKYIGLRNDITSRPLSRHAREWRFAQAVGDLKAFLVRYGLPAGEADSLIAEAAGRKSAGWVHTTLNRYRKRHYART